MATGSVAITAGSGTPIRIVTNAGVDSGADQQVVTLADSAGNLLGTTALPFLVQPVSDPDTTATGTLTATDVVVAAPAGDGALLSGTPTANSTVSVTAPGGDSSWDAQLSGTFGGGTVYFEGSFDGGTTWLPLNGRQTGIVNTVLGFSTTVAGVWRGNTSGLTSLRVRVKGATSPSIAVTLRIAAGVGALFLNASIPAGTNYVGKVRLTDGTNDLDPGKVVIGALTTAGTTADGTTDVSSYSSVRFQKTSGGIAQVEASNDGTTWYNNPITQLDSLGEPGWVFQGSGAGLWGGPLIGRYFRLRQVVQSGNDAPVIVYSQAAFTPKWQQLGASVGTNIGNVGFSSVPSMSAQQADRILLGTISATDAVVAAATPDGTTLSGTPTANSAVTLNISTQAIPNVTTAFNLTGTFGGGTVYFEGSVDGNNYFALVGSRAGTGVGSGPVYSATAAGVYRFSVAGLASVRARIKGATTPSVPVTIETTVASLPPATADPTPSTLVVVATAAAATAVTATLPAPGAGLFHYITSIQVERFMTAAGTAAGTAVLSTVTNLTGPTWNLPTDAAGQGTVAMVADYRPGTPLKVTAANTATTIGTPAVASTIFRILVTYYVAP